VGQHPESTGEGICIPFWKINIFFMHAAVQSASHSFSEGLQRRFRAYARALRIYRADSQFAVVIIGHFAPVPEEDADV